jgi:hypothetical protein
MKLFQCFVLFYLSCGYVIAAKDATKPVVKSLSRKEVLQKFSAWKKTLDSEHLAHVELAEKQLRQYLPGYQRRKVMGLESEWEYVVDNPALPRILLIGDYISRAYTLPLRKALEGKANLHRPPANCGTVSYELRNLDSWLGPKSWDIIQFNFGLHDRKTPIKQYENDLEAFVLRLKKTGAKLVWATTTPLHKPNPKDKAKASLQDHHDRRSAAEAVMQKHGVIINDLYQALVTNPLNQRSLDDPHLSDQGLVSVVEHTTKLFDTLTP